MTVQQALVHLARPFSFAVVGDTHFVTRGFEQPHDHRPLTAKDYLKNVTYALAPMMDALRAQKPDFVFFTGDIAETQGDQAQMDLQAGLDFFRTSDIPLLFAPGNRDAAYDAVIAPYLKTVLGWAPEAKYYAFDTGGCRFVALDSTAWISGGAQHRWLEGVLGERREKSGRVFLFGHHPIWPVARAFCSPPDFCRDMVDLLSRYPVDTCFCGHTHNQNMVLHRTEGLPVLQCMGAVIGVSDEPPVALDQVQSLLLSPDDILAIWPGYLENTAPGWFLVRVDGYQAMVEWHHLNRGIEAVMRWYCPGDIRSFWAMEQVLPERLIPMDLNRIRRAFLRFSAWDGREGMRLYFNGEDVGALPVGKGFAPMRLELPDGALPGIQMENRLRIVPTEGTRCALGNLVVEVVLPGGRCVRTAPTGEIFSWSETWRVWAYPQLKVLKPGQALTTMLSF